MLSRVGSEHSTAFRVETVTSDGGLRSPDFVVESLRCLPAGYPVLLIGPTGCGKSVTARKLHDRWSVEQARKGPFIQLNCAALPSGLVESELFGYEEGSHGTAKSSSPGLIEGAAGGTVFLDEIGELPMSVQAKLLVALDSDARSGHLTIRRIGARSARTVDARLVLGTNRDLHGMTTRGEFRLDLLGRIKTHTIDLPALSRTPHRILPAYIGHIQEASARYPKNVRFALTPKAHELLRSFSASTEASWVWNYRDVEQSAHQLTFAALRRGKPTSEHVFWVEAADVEEEIGRLSREWRKHANEAASSSDEWAPLRLALDDGEVGRLTLLQRHEALWLLRAREGTTSRAAAWRWLVERNVYKSTSRKSDAQTPDTARFDARWKKYFASGARSR